MEAARGLQLAARLCMRNRGVWWVSAFQTALEGFYDGLFVLDALAEGAEEDCAGLEFLRGERPVLRRHLASSIIVASMSALAKTWTQRCSLMAR